MSFFKKKTYRSKKYLAFIDSKPCLICGRASTHHHVRLYGGGGVGMKPPDNYCVPICVKCHTQLHAMPERDFWSYSNIDICVEILDLNAEYLAKECL